MEQEASNGAAAIELGTICTSPATNAPPAASLVVLGAGALLFGCFGIAYALPIFFLLIGRTLAIPLPHLTALFSVTGALYFALGLVSGPLADRLGARPVAVIGSAVLAAGLLVASRAANALTFDLGYVFGVGTGIGLCFVPAVGAVQALCRERPALAGGVAAAGIGLGTLVLPPATQFAIDHLGWRPVLLCLSVIAACGSLAALPLAKPATPAARGRRPDVPDRLAPLAAMSRSPRFWLLYMAQLLISLVAFVPFAHLVLFAEARGWSAATGGYLIGLIGVGSLVGRLLLGIVAEALGSCRTAGLCAVVMAAALGLLPATIDRWELGGAAMLYGFGYGGVIGLTGPIVAEVLGVRGICGAVGLVTTSRALGVLVGPSAVGLMAHRLGGYDLPFLTCAALALLAGLLLAALPRPAARPQKFAYILRGLSSQGDDK